MPRLPKVEAIQRKLPSDRYKWLLDVLAVLAEGGAFTATPEELKEIETKVAFEVQRKPEVAVRRCKIEW